MVTRNTSVTFHPHASMLNKLAFRQYSGDFLDGSKIAKKDDEANFVSVGFLLLVKCNSVLEFLFAFHWKVVL